MNVNEFSQIFSIILSDQVIFPIFEATLLFIFVYGLIADYIRKNSGLAVSRGGKARGIITGVASVLISFVSIQIVNSTGVWKEYRVILILANLFFVTYLCFFNSWFRNKIMGFYVRFENKTEKL